MSHPSTEGAIDGTPVVLLYDAGCPLCQRARDWLAARVQAGHLNFVPCGSETHHRLAPQVSDEACMRALQLVLPEGRVLAGAEALPVLLGATRRWGWVAHILCFPGLRRLAPYAYEWLARHRYALSAFLPRPAGDRRCGAAPPRS